MGLLNFLGGVGSIVQNAIDSRQQRKNIDLQNKQNKVLADYQYNKDVEFWNKQNAYNSPVEQMKRFKEAGLNPNLIFSQGTPGNATTLAKYQAPTQSFNYRPKTNLPETLSQYSDFSLGMKRNKAQDLQNFISENAGKLAWYKALTSANMYDFMFSDLNDPGTLGSNFLGKNQFGKDMLIPAYQNALNAMLQGKANLFNTQTGYALRSQQQLLNDLELGFQRSGGKWFNPVIQFLRLFKK